MVTDKPPIDAPPPVMVPAPPGPAPAEAGVPAPPVAYTPTAPAAGVGEVDPARFAEAHRQLLADTSIQFDLPMYEPPEVQRPAGWEMDLARFFSAEHPVLRVLLWAVVAIVAALILYFVGRALWRWWEGRQGYGDDGAGDAAWEPLVEAGEARALLAEADALAARGLFSEAAHLLLFRSLVDVDERRPGLLRPALTSRDIAALPALPERPRGAFARIAAAVERSLFGRRALDAGDWGECRRAYEEFAFAEGWRG